MPKTNPARYADPVRATRTKQETARLVGCGDLKIDELMDSDILQFVQVGNRRQPTVASIERLLGKPIEQLERHLVMQAVAAPTAPKIREDTANG
jgi:hypothetical protein